jgi:hypothetical protein
MRTRVESPSHGSSGMVAFVLASALLLAGCTAWSPSAEEPKSPSPVANSVPSPSPTDWTKFISIGPDDYGLSGDGWSEDQVLVWAEKYCELEDLTPCEGIADRAVHLCIEKWDCHPALLVPFEEGAVAFLAGGIFPEPQVAAVWHGESDPVLEQYGGAQTLLEAYLLTVGVCRDDGVQPRGATCDSEPPTAAVPTPSEGED